MTYTKTYQPERYTQIEGICKALESLSPGETYLLEGDSLSLKKARSLLYDWLYHSCQQGQFKIKRLPSSLLIERIPLLQLRGRKLTKSEEELSTIIEKALGEENPGEYLRGVLPPGEMLAEAIKRIGSILNLG